MGKGTTKTHRKSLIQLIHIGKSKLGWDDAAYRAFLSGICEKESAADMNVKELNAALSAMRSLGFPPSGQAVCALTRRAGQRVSS